jgi:UDP-glucose 4-epimerase
MRVLVTGGTGFVGSHMCNALVRRGHTVSMLSTRPERLGSEIPVHRCDITDSKAVRRVIRQERPDAVYHLAASYLKAEIRTLYPINSEGTYNILKAIYDSGIESKVIFSSSQSVYGRPLSLPVSEDYPCQPSSAYSRTKLAAEFLCKSFSLLGTPVVILRISTVYGPGQTRANIVSDFVKFGRSMKRINVYGSLDRSEDIVYVDDVVAALCSALLVESPFEVINVGGGRETPVYDLARIIGEKLGVPVDTVAEENFPPRRMFLCIDKAKMLLNYSPIPLEDGLTKFIEGLR